MRVALIAPSVRGAMGQYLEAVAPALSKEVELHLFVPVHFKADQLGNTVLHRFRTGQRRTEALARLLNPLAALAVWREIQTLRPNVIHLFNGEGYPWSLLWAKWASRDHIPIFVTLHDPEPHPGNAWEKLNAKLRSYVLKRAHSVHVHCGCFTQLARAQGARSVKVIPHGSLAGRFLKFKKEGIQREPVALFFGRIEPYKGVEVLVEAGLILKGKPRIIIAGPGKLSRDLLNQIQARPDVFELHNRYLADSEVAQLFQRTSVCVLPYRQATQSSVPLISAAFGVPVVATAVGAFKEDVPRVGGILVPPNDPSALAKAIEKALGSLSPIYPQELEFVYVAGEFAGWYCEHG